MVEKPKKSFLNIIGPLGSGKPPLGNPKPTRRIR